MNSSILFKTKHLKALLALRDSSQAWSIATLAKASGATYVHTCNFLIACEKLGITKSERHGGSKIISLTEKGSKMAEMLAAVSQSMSSSAPTEPEAQKKAEPEK